MTSSTSTAAWKRVRAWAFATGLALSGYALSACSSDSEGASAAGSESTGAESTGAESTGASGSGLAAEVAELTKPLAAYPVPTEPVSDVAGLAGTTVYYIPITQQAPQFSVTGKALTTALGKVGVDVQICDGKGTPTDVNACVTQAVEAKAGAIVSDAIPYGLAANGFDAAQAAGIPVIISNNFPDDAHQPSKTLEYIGQEAGVAMDESLSKFIALDSGGKADVLVNLDTDGPSPVKFDEAGAAALAAACPDCKRSTNQVSSSNFALVAPSTSAALLKDPSINYLSVQFAQFLQPSQSGVQQTSRTDIKIVTGAAQLSSIKDVANGTIAAAAATASAFQGWVDADASLRLMLGTELPTYTIPTRLFTKDTMDDVELTDEAEQSGAWYGPTSFVDDFAKLWGVA